jgi:hypothetical protein
MTVRVCRRRVPLRFRPVRGAETVRKARLEACQIPHSHLQYIQEIQYRIWHAPAACWTTPAPILRITSSLISHRSRGHPEQFLGLPEFRPEAQAELGNVSDPSSWDSLGRKGKNTLPGKIWADGLYIFN